VKIEEVLNFRKASPEKCHRTRLDIQKVLNNISEIQEDVQYSSKVSVIQEFAGELLENKVDVNQLHDLQVN
jgi:hypothetical protein